MSAISPKIGDSSPWGRIDHAKNLADGIVSVGTPGHGGIHLSPELNAAMPSSFKSEDGWYEEDCEWALVALVYPNAFKEEERVSAHNTVKNWMPDAYEAWSGVTLQPGESREKDERAFLKEHAEDWLVTSAFGSWHESVPDGLVGVYAKPGAYLKTSSADATQTRTFLVSQQEYETRLGNRGIFICDPSRHPAWDPKKPKNEQVLECAAEEGADKSDRETLMADGVVRKVPAGVHPKGPVIAYNMRTADDCCKSIVYGTSKLSRMTEIEGGAWAPDEPDLQTVSVDIEIHHGPGDCDNAELSGDQHRALEDGGLLSDFLVLLAARDPDGADELLKEVSPEGVSP